MIPRFVGFSSLLRGDADIVREIWSARRPGVLLGIGARTSHAIVHRLPCPDRASFPALDDLPRIFAGEVRGIRSLAYEDRFGGGDLAESLVLASRYAGPTLDALVLVTRWPDPADLRAFRRHQRSVGGAKSVRLIFTLNAARLEELGNDSSMFLERLGPYVRGGLLDGVRFRWLGEEGFDVVDRIRSGILMVGTEYPRLSIVVSGPPTHAFLSIVSPLVALVPGICLEAVSSPPLDARTAGLFLRDALHLVEPSPFGT